MDTSQLVLKLDRKEPDDLPPGVSYLKKLLHKSKTNREFMYRFSVFLLTYVAYVCYHMSRKPLSIVKNSKEFLNCFEHSGVCVSWFDEINGQPVETANSY